MFIDPKNDRRFIQFQSIQANNLTSKILKHIEKKHKEPYSEHNKKWIKNYLEETKNPNLVAFTSSETGEDRWVVAFDDHQEFWVDSFLSKKALDTFIAKMIK